MIVIARFWGEHCVCGSFGARMLRAMLATWVYVVVTSVLFVIWPMEGMPVRGASMWWMMSWLIPTLTFQVLVFWVVDANLLLTRFIRHLSEHHAIWPGTLQMEHKKTFGMLKHPCIDEWVDLQLIAKRTSAVNRLIYAPTVVLLILLASRSSLFDNWPTPPGLIISYLLTALVLLVSALSLRRAAEKSRTRCLATTRRLSAANTRNDALLRQVQDDPRAGRDVQYRLVLTLRRRPADQGAAAVADRYRRLGHCRCVELCEVLAATRIAFSTAEAGFLTLTKKRRIAHDRLAGMIERHLRNVVVVIGHADH